MLPRLNPFEYFTDTNGDPLDGGYVYIGTANQNPRTSPVTVYFDSAMTIPAPQPLRTTAGRIVKSGSPAAIYFSAETFSILVENKSGQQIAFSANAENSIASLGSSNGSSLVSFLQSGSGADPRSVQSKLRDIVSVKDFGAIGDGATDDTSAIQDAITASYGKRLYIPPGTYIINGTLNITSTIDVCGDGVGNTTLKKTGLGHILDALSAVNKNDIAISGITFDVNNIDTAIAVQYVTRFRVSDCRFYNMQYWGVFVGVSNGADSVIRNNDIIIERCSFDTSTSTYEQILPFNSRNVVVRDCTFTTGASANGIGLYQHLDDVLIQRCKFTGGLARAVYYSLSCNNITVDECIFDSVTGGVIGANESDNGAFGYTTVKNLLVSKTRFTNVTGSPLELGAVTGAVVKQCVFDVNQQYGIIVHDGNTPVVGQPVNYSIVDCIFANNNVSNISSLSAPGIRFDTIGGTHNALIRGCIFYDDRGTPRQLYPITFSGAFTWSNITIDGCILNAYSGGVSIGTTGGAAFGSNVFVTGTNQALTASLPTGIATNIAPRASSGNRVTVTYGPSMTFDAREGNFFRIIATDTAAHTINAPTNPTTGQKITITVENGSGGVMGAATWNAVFKLAAWTQPANLFSRSIDFVYNGGNWVEVSRTTTDIPR